MRLVNAEYFVESNLDAPPDKDNPGGGINSKIWNIKRAFPEMELGTELGDSVNIIDPIWLNLYNTNETLNEKITQIEESSAVNILWQEELSVFRFTSSPYRFKLFRVVDGIINCNVYLNEMMKAYISSPMHILYTPIDADFYSPTEKKPQVVAMGRVATCKNVRGIIDLFKALPDHIHKIYIGNVDLWGGKSTQYVKGVERGLQSELDSVCEWHPSLNKQDVAGILSESWGYVNMSRYDTGCLSFLESAMSGCHCFCWHPHPMFDEYSFINRFHGVEDGAEVIVSEFEKGSGPNKSLRNYIVAKHGYESVRQSFKRIMAKVILG